MGDDTVLANEVYERQWPQIAAVLKAQLPDHYGILTKKSNGDHFNSDHSCLDEVARDVARKLIYG